MAGADPAGGGGGPGGRRLGAAGRRELEDRGGAAEGIVVKDDGVDSEDGTGKAMEASLSAGKGDG